ncbi:MAG: PLP-dependent aminotransferase family protein [Candidatus Zixiibacteriota bacterium]|nr:MAG: PLP-dependent aminotransferase family protein [candidate division Zixibacteria bacterium]
MTRNWKPKLGKTDQPLYLAIVQALADDISSGVLASGTRLPTHRELADDLKVAIGTVTHAYTEAEKLGLVHSEGRRGTFVGESRLGLTGSGGPFEPSSHLMDLQRFYPPFGDDPDLSVALRRLARSPSIQWMLHYVPFGGLERHREAGAQWVERLGMKVDPDSIAITSGAHNALYLIFASLLQKGDVVVADSHTYPGFSEIVRFLGLRPIGISTDEDGMVPDELEAICARRKVAALYCNPTMHNPTAATMTEARRRSVAALAEKHGFVIIENEINRAFVPDPPPLISSIAPDRSYLVASVSKIVAAGLRACFVACPPESVNQLNNAAHAALYNVSPLLLEILTLWLKDGTVDSTIRRRRAEISRRQTLFHEIVGSRHTACTNPHGYFAWLQLPGNWTTHRYVAEARARGVKISPAEAFVTKGCKPANAVRVCFGANTNHDTLRQGLLTLSDILDRPGRSGAPTI